MGIEVAYSGVPEGWSPGAVERVSVALLKAAHSPRLAGVEGDHVDLLAQSDIRFPPIIVHRETMKVLDGIHRLEAAVLRGHEDVDVVFFDGSLNEGFALAVRNNVTHGLPLKIADREAAAVQLLIAFPTWSDRGIAANVGLSAGKVASLRTATGTDSETARVGRDGRVRPTDREVGRRRAVEFISRNPDASLRQIALAAGISPNTARVVRSSLGGPDGAVASDVEPADPKIKKAKPEQADRDVETLQREEPDVILQQLQRDPSLRYSESGRRLLRWLAPKVTCTQRWLDLVGQIPPHAQYALANLARSCAQEWQHMAERLEKAAEVGRPSN